MVNNSIDWPKKKALLSKFVLKDAFISSPRKLSYRVRLTTEGYANAIIGEHASSIRYIIRKLRNDAQYRKEAEYAVEAVFEDNSILPLAEVTCVNGHANVQAGNSQLLSLFEWVLQTT